MTTDAQVAEIQQLLEPAGTHVTRLATPDIVALDQIAALLGDPWDDLPGLVEQIASLVGSTTRPHPGERSEQTYAARFLAATGRYIERAFDFEELVDLLVTHYRDASDMLLSAATLDRTIAEYERRQGRPRADAAVQHRAVTAAFRQLSGGPDI